MVRRLIVVAGVGVGLLGACSFDLSGFSGGGDADAAADTGVDDVLTGVDAPADTDSGPDSSSCSCEGLVSAYRFSDPKSLGHDFLGNNNMVTVHGSPKSSPMTPPGLHGHSIDLDGSSSVCIESGFTFDSTSDHTLCFWARPAALADSTNVFAQTCGYDTWTASSGVDYLWRINNCNSGTPANLQVPGIYSIGKWVQVCQTYVKATKTRTAIFDGNPASKRSVTDTVPIVEDPSGIWCIGSYSGGGYWTGLIYQPTWFSRVLSDAEIAEVSAKACCLP